MTRCDNVSHAGPEAIKVAWKRDGLDDAVPASQATLEGEASPAHRGLIVTSTYHRLLSTRAHGPCCPRATHTVDTALNIEPQQTTASPDHVHLHIIRCRRYPRVRLCACEALSCRAGRKMTNAMGSQRS